METQQFNSTQIQAAAALLQQGELVAFPTETVYGLGAIATDAQAVAKVFAAKGRPSDNPLIVHVASIAQVRHYVDDLSPLAERLMQQFWPGPLTIVLPVDATHFPSNVNAGKPTIAFRMPDQKDTLALIEQVGEPLVGPSANLSGKPSPTQLAHVLQDFDGVIGGILTSEQPISQIGVESTVVRPLNDEIKILRPGAITQAQLQVICPNTEELSASAQLQAPDLLSPGIKYTHYSPTQPVYLVAPNTPIDEWKVKLATLSEPIGILGDEVVVQLLNSFPGVVATYSLGAKGDIASATRELYAGLRALEQSRCQIIVAQSFSDEAASHAYLNRLTKASQNML